MREPMVLEDVQSEKDGRNIALSKVGLKALKRPVILIDDGPKPQHTVALMNLYVDLPAHAKGTHMSRFIEVLEANVFPLSVHNIHTLVEKMIGRLGAKNGYIELKFTYFKMKKAPVSLAESLLDYEVELYASIVNGQHKLQVVVDVPMMSLCPCSKKISEFNAHNQRASVKLLVEATPVMSIDEIIAIAERGASSQLYSIIKREDEKYITEYAYQHPKFVEDMARELAEQLVSYKNIRYYRVSCENFESIHNHSAYAEIEGGSHYKP